MPSVVMTAPAFDPMLRDRVRDANPIAGVINASLAAAGHAPLSGHGDELAGWHPGDRSKSGMSLKVSVSKGLYNCFHCGQGGDVFAWVMQERGCTFVEALHELAYRAGIALPALDPTQQQAWQQQQQDRHDLETLFRAVAAFYHGSLTQAHMDVCAQHWGLTPATLTQYHIGFAPVADDALQQALRQQHFADALIQKSGLVIGVGSRWHDFFQGRLIFPYWRDLPGASTSVPGTPLYFIGRRLDGVTPDTPWEQAKYRKQLVHNAKHSYVSPAVTNTYFYGEHTLRGMHDRALLVTEGVTDCLAALQVGVPTISPVTVRFSAASHPRLLQLAQKAQRLLICNDAEDSEAGLKGALDTMAFLDSHQIDARLVTLPRAAGVSKVDLAEYLTQYTAADFLQLCDQALEYLAARMHTYARSADAYANCLAARRFVLDVLQTYPRQQEARAFLRHRAQAYWGLTESDMADLLQVYESLQVPVPPSQWGTPSQKAATSQGPVMSIWDTAPTAYDFAYQHETIGETLVENLMVPEGITIIAAPRGVGKTHFAIALAVAVSSGGKFLGNPTNTLRVMLVDRDNSARTIRKRLREWGVTKTRDFRVVGRVNNAPSLLSRDGWQQFPVDQYDIVIIDSLGSGSEGVSETEGRLTQEVMAVIKDLARQGPSVLLLDNTIKSGVNMRGRGEKADAVDIIYEVRDVTDWTPTREDWWEELPAAGEHAWVQQATRLLGKPFRRMAFVPTKFRDDTYPDPFIVELDFRTTPRTIRDVTSEVLDAALHQGISLNGVHKEKERLATEALTEHLHALPAGAYLKKGEAVDFLQTKELNRTQARTLLSTEDGQSWDLRSLPGRGNAVGVFCRCLPVTSGENGRNKPCVQSKQNQPSSPIPISAVCIDGERQKTGVVNPAYLATENGVGISAVVPASSPAEMGVPGQEEGVIDQPSEGKKPAFQFDSSSQSAFTDFSANALWCAICQRAQSVRLEAAAYLCTVCGATLGMKTVGADYGPLYSGEEAHGKPLGACLHPETVFQESYLICALCGDYLF